MKRKHLTKISCIILLTALVTPVYAQSNLRLLFTVPYGVTDVAVSADGRYVAAVNDTTLTYYRVEDGSLLWWFNDTVVEYFSINYTLSILSVVVSANGEYVAIGYGDQYTNGGVGYFNESSSRTGRVTNTTWTHFYQNSSKKISGEVYKRCLDISDDGEIITVAGTGDSVYYFINCTEKRGLSSCHDDWVYPVFFGELTCLDMTPDGDYFVAAGEKIEYPEIRQNFTIAYFNSTNIRWKNSYTWYGKAWDIAISDDGAGVCVGYTNSNTSQSGVMYWNNSDTAENMQGPGPNNPASWYYGEAMEQQTTVDVSGDGEKVLGGSNGTSTLYCWLDSISNNGYTTPDWEWGVSVLDVALSGDGGIGAAATVEGDPYIRVLDAENNSLSVYRLEHEGKAISMSRDGAVIAVGSPSGASLKVFKLEDALVTTSTDTGEASFAVDQGGISYLGAVGMDELPEEGRPFMDFVHGFFNFNITGIDEGATVNITITLPEPVPQGTMYCKYGPTPNNTEPHYYLIPIGSDDGDNVIWITITDGGLGDNDLTVNGVIIDDGGPGSPFEPPVGGSILANALSQTYQLYLLIALIIAGSMFKLKRRVR